MTKRLTITNRPRRALGPSSKPPSREAFAVSIPPPIISSQESDSALPWLKLLKTDHEDLLLLHGLGLETFEDLTALQSQNGALRYLHQAKARGLTRFIGFSSHPVQMAAHATSL